MFSFSGNCSRCLIFNVCVKGLVTLGRFYSALNRVQYRFTWHKTILVNLNQRSAIDFPYHSTADFQRQKLSFFSHLEL